jgi:hypothetical protein
VLRGAVVLLLLSLLAILAGQADAAGHQQRKRQRAGHATLLPTASRDRKPATGEGGPAYYEHVLGKVPFGSKRWWSIYEEQHGTPD